MKKIHLLLIALLLPCWLTAQVDLIPQRFAFEPELNYRSDIPSPASVLGYELGERFTEYAQTVDYFEKLAAASDRIMLGNYGATYEGRPLIYLLISSADNIKNIETIRQNNLLLADPTQTATARAQEIMENHPVVVSYSYNIHGNEASSTEAAKQVAYRLAASTDRENEELLDNVVFLMFPCINPDGRSRYVNWYNSMARSVIANHSRDLEHYAPWPNGRTNHYWFDLNRDWIWGVHPESRGHTKIYQEWMPQVHTDYHEQGYNSNYFTVPGTTPRNKLLPDDYEALADTFGMANIAAFDRNKIGYFTREAFDFYYPGYGSSYPSVMGAVGMLTEQGGIGAGRAIQTEDGTDLVLRQRIFDHYLTSIATLQKAAEHKQIFQQYSYNALDPNQSKMPGMTYILPDAPDGYLYEVLKILKHHNVTIERAEADFSVSGVQDYQSKNSQNKKFQSGTFLIKTDQPRHLFINSIFSPEMAIEDSVMYDMSTWAVPLAYNLEAYRSNRAITVKTSVVKDLPKPQTGVQGTADAYAYVINWQQLNAPKALSLLWQKKYRVRAAGKPFFDGNKHYPEGTLIVLTGRNLEKSTQIQADMQEIAQQADVLIDALPTGRMREGIDLVSRFTRPVKQPRVAMLVEPPFDTYTCGQLYFLFDQITALPVERIRTSIFQPTAGPNFRVRYGGAKLEDYDVLILAGGGSGLKQLFGKKELERISRWVRNGGVLIGTEEAADFLTKKNSDFTNVHLIQPPKDSSQAAALVPFAEQRDFRGKKNIPGAALNASLDTTNPLAFGMKKDLFTLKFGSNSLKPAVGFQTVGRYHPVPAELLASGYAPKESLELLAGNAFAGVQPLGSGKVVFLMDNTQYRMFWRGPSRMMQNAVMLLPGM